VCCVQPLGFRFVWQQFRQHLGQGDGLVAQVPPDEVVPGAGRVSLVEYQVPQAEGAREARPQVPQLSGGLTRAYVRRLLLGGAKAVLIPV
jgi:hypothetical protein